MTLDYLLAYVTYNPDDGIFRWACDRQGRWNIKQGDFAGSRILHKCRKSYIRLTLGGSHIAAHRAAFLFMEGKMPAEVDHENGNGCDNRWANLKPSTRKTNAKNLRLRVESQSGTVGVSWDKNRQKWLASISNHGIRKNLGRYDSLISAIRARKEAEILFQFHPNHGEVRPL